MIQPNFHAAEKLDSLMDKVSELTDDLDRLKEEFLKATTEFESVKKKRKQLFEVSACHLRLRAAAKSDRILCICRIALIISRRHLTRHTRS